MKKQGLLSVGEFSRITRTPPDTLYYYDRIGLLPPASRAENKYRYYSIRQLALCNTIRILRRLGVPLAEIQELKDRRTAEITEQVLLRQITELDSRKERLEHAENLLHTMLRSIRSGLAVDTESITIQHCPAVLVNQTIIAMAKRTMKPCLLFTGECQQNIKRQNMI